jgi:hypothetical protein
MLVGGTSEAVQVGMGASADVFAGRGLELPVLSLAQVAVDVGTRAIICATGAIPLVSFVSNAMNVALGALDVVNTCMPGTSVERVHRVSAIGSVDPNIKIGGAGALAARFTSGNEPFRYAVLFENLETATAPAQEVVITDQLDPAVFDFSTFSLGAISFGDDVVDPPPGRRDFATTVDLRPGKNLLVQIDAGLDVLTGQVTWRFTSIDPATGQLPEDPTAGFLPPNTSPPAGEGRVLFTVAPKGSLTTGTEVSNAASIVFDLNAAIQTNTWTNTIDRSAPSSQVNAVVPDPGEGLSVQWSGTDAGAGVLDYTIFVAGGDGPFSPWLTNTTATTGTFVGTCGKRYRFYSVARDATGNVEAPPASHDAEIAVAYCNLAVTAISARKTITLSPKKPFSALQIGVEIQNRGANSETIPDAVTLGELVSLTVESLATCTAPAVVLHSGKPQKTLPVTLKPKQKLKVIFDVTFSCANDPAKSSKRDPGHADYRLSARLNRLTLGGVDPEAADDVCPRAAVPAGPNLPGAPKIIDKGCGAKQPDGTLGAVVDIFVKP